MGYDRSEVAEANFLDDGGIPDECKGCSQLQNQKLKFKKKKSRCTVDDSKHESHVAEYRSRCKHVLGWEEHNMAKNKIETKERQCNLL